MGDYMTFTGHPHSLMTFIAILATMSAVALLVVTFWPSRPPAEEEEKKETQRKDPRARSRPLYDIPYMFEAREFLRKKLIGKKVNKECCVTLQFCSL